MQRRELLTWTLSALTFSVACGAVVLPTQATAAETSAAHWEPVDNFDRGSTHWTVSAGVGSGYSCLLTSRQAHDWALATVEWGKVLTDRCGEGRWYEGNVEVLAQIFGGGQFSPSTAYIIGAAPLVRYNFTGLRAVIPFVDAGAGISATDIRDGSLSTTFEFNLQAGAGAHVFLKDDLALTLQYRLYHISNAGIDSPNAGVNTGTFLAGISWMF